MSIYNLSSTFVNYPTTLSLHLYLFYIYSRLFRTYVRTRTVRSKKKKNHDRDEYLPTPFQTRRDKRHSIERGQNHRLHTYLPTYLRTLK